MSEMLPFELFDQRIMKTVPGFCEDSGTYSQTAKSLAGAIEGAKQSAPYLRDLIDRFPEISAGLAASSPESIFRDIIDTVDGTHQTQDLWRVLRRAKQQAHLLTALCDLGGVWDWVKVTESLSELADVCMAALIENTANDMGFQANERGPVPGLFVLALGKYGSRELNYSSDIDLIVFYDPDHIKLPDPSKAERTLVRFVRKLMRGFDEITADGYVFRTDLRLRPDPRSNSVAVSTYTAERYYEVLGQNWERAAMIKARYCGGDQQAAAAFIKDVLHPFIWRRSLDYAAISDIHSIKRQMQGNQAGNIIKAGGHHLKLGFGGIREIEFYAQVQQLILGGRQPALRTPRTVDALAALAVGGYSAQEEVAELTEHYGVLRDLEHRLQMRRDEQTHVWPENAKDVGAMVALCGQTNITRFEAGLVKRLQRVNTLYTGLFPGEDDLSTAMGNLVFTGVEAEEPTLDTLSAYGFTRGPDVWREMADWLGGRLPATRSPRARELLTQLAPKIIEGCGATGVADQAFYNFGVFIGNLNAGVSLLSLLLNQPKALLTLINVLSLAPPLAPILAENPSWLDAMVEPDFLAGGYSDLTGKYSDLIGENSDFEQALDAVRRAVHEDQFNVIASVLTSQNASLAGDRFSKIARAAINILLPVARQETERSFGPLTGEYAIVALGKLGGSELSFSSDLDVMLVFDAAGQDTQTLFNKFTRRVITALSSMTSEGGLYEVDMALRPSGRSGPLAVSVQAFEKYYRSDAWTWEYMALTRAAILASSSASFATKLTDKVDELISSKTYDGKLEHDILDMHTRLGRDKPAKNIWDIKGVKGGLRDIEFVAQYFALRHNCPRRNVSTLDMLTWAKAGNYLSLVDADRLSEIVTKYQAVIQVIAITTDGGFEPAAKTGRIRALMAAVAGAADFGELDIWYEQARLDVIRIFKASIKK